MRRRLGLLVNKEEYFFVVVVEEMINTVRVKVQRERERVEDSRQKGKKRRGGAPMWVASANRV